MLIIDFKHCFNFRHRAGILSVRPGNGIGAVAIVPPQLFSKSIRLTVDLHRTSTVVRRRWSGLRDRYCGPYSSVCKGVARSELVSPSTGTSSQQIKSCIIYQHKYIYIYICYIHYIQNPHHTLYNHIDINNSKHTYCIHIIKHCYMQQLPSSNTHTYIHHSTVLIPALLHITSLQYYWLHLHYPTTLKAVVCSLA